MSRRNRLIRRLEDRWIACFGEPPPIRTDPELMQAILEEAGAPSSQPKAVTNQDRLEEMPA